MNANIVKFAIEVSIAGKRAKKNRESFRKVAKCRTFEFTGIHGAERSINPVQRFGTPDMDVSLWW
jgi:hypothetical protein